MALKSAGSVPRNESACGAHHGDVFNDDAKSLTMSTWHESDRMAGIFENNKTKG